jgi:Flp pilus assembly protein TadB
MRRREQDLQERERALRLRELEAELYQQTQPTEPPVSPTTKHQATSRSLNRRVRQAIEIAKFLGIVVAIVVAAKVATWLATVAIIGGIAFVAYKLFFANKGRR